MTYSDRFHISDLYVEHANSIMENIDDPLIRVRYAGFLAVTAVTVFKLAFKDIVYEFAEKKHKVFGSHVRAFYDKLNGQVSLSDIRKRHVARFGDTYKRRFEKRLDEKEKESLASGRGSIRSSYGNLITWRHGFVHDGELPTTATYEEARRSYELGKEVFDCLALSLRR